MVGMVRKTDSHNDASLGVSTLSLDPGELCKHVAMVRGNRMARPLHMSANDPNVVV